MANWYKNFKEIEEREVVLGIAINDRLYYSIEDVREFIDYEFNSGYGSSNGPAFTLWTECNVYFPGVYDGAEWIDSVPRNPCNISTAHIGGQ